MSNGYFKRALMSGCLNADPRREVSKDCHACQGLLWKQSTIARRSINPSTYISTMFEVASLLHYWSSQEITSQFYIHSILVRYLSTVDRGQRIDHEIYQFRPKHLSNNNPQGTGDFVTVAKRGRNSDSPIATARMLPDLTPNSRLLRGNTRLNTAAKQTAANHQ